VLRLLWREWRWKDAEILMLRHQPRAYSRLTWPDRAWLALLAGTVPAERLAAMRPIVTPATIVRWQRDMVRRKWARCVVGSTDIWRTAWAGWGAVRGTVGFHGRHGRAALSGVFRLDVRG
jgi:hypothetical protein